MYKTSEFQNFIEFTIKKVPQPGIEPGPPA